MRPKPNLSISPISQKINPPPSNHIIDFVKGSERRRFSLIFLLYTLSSFPLGKIDLLMAMVVEIEGEMWLWWRLAHPLKVVFFFSLDGNDKNNLCFFV